MTFSLTSRPPSPTNSSHPQIPQDGHSGVSTDSHHRPAFADAETMKERPFLEIRLDNDVVYLKGTGNDVEPARLTGHVVLNLAESTPIKEITLQFRGKARLPPPSPRLINNDSSMHSVATYVICNHDWSFLEGERKHSHTLKAGRHYFPFQLQIGGSLPSSITTGVFGGASVAYKLRAHAVRPGLVNSNLQTTRAVQILRAFSAEALEYQQTLEIENTWPDKLMYSIMIPHKAWAATDTLTALVKFSPLVKGVGVVSVASAIHEQTKIYARNTVQETTRIVASVKHDIIGGKAVEVVDRPRWTMGTPSAPSASPSSNTPPLQTASGGYFPSSNAQPEAGPSTQPETLEVEQGQDDVVTFITLQIPASVTPTHPLEPISVSHRLRWSILIINPDGHTSELRCSLPLHLLDRRLLKDAQRPPDDEEEIELPSYKAHVRDRVANMYLPEAVTVRVTNPFMAASPGHTPPASGLQTPSALVSRSGHATPMHPQSLSHLPHAPGDSTPLEWINSELLLSVQTSSPPTEFPPLPDNERSRPPSARPSRRPSRAPSPERHHLTSDALMANETYVHSSNASRNLHALFSVSMKPASAHPHWPGIGSRSTSNLNSLNDNSHNRNPTRSNGSRPPAAPESTTPTNSSLLLRAYTEVPNYSVAARGFLGGVQPLSSLQGLPSYEEAERHVGHIASNHGAPVMPAH
ncbi:Arrestin-C domain-containing protein [Mycena indigotica]|uniref:Arrestin-C domain-containing protein n=1 Tax=Mycena indigotica TaxID=2126181 RepID=A0A8H6THC2_9AGAR|nr:Arrestin-C domain-containing protein [Mycena indigotica]KAF7315760.1 Arrestin-C domain-containing protein [Mycena indigotica]